MGTLGRLIIGGLLVMTAHALASGNAMAEGALAVGVTSDLSEGSAVGYAFDRTTREKATAEALKECQTTDVGTAKTRARCRVVATFKRECFAVAMTQTAPGFGWATGPDKATAEQRAITACRPTAGRGSLCKVATSGCDTQDKYNE